MIAKENKNIMITLSKNDFKKLEEYTKQKSKEIGFKLTKSQAISMLICNLNNKEEKAIGQPTPVQQVFAQPVVTQQVVTDSQFIGELRGKTMRPHDTKDMSLLQQLIDYLNYDCRFSYTQIGRMLNPQVSERTIKDYMYGKIKNPSEDKIIQLKALCKKHGKDFKTNRP